MLFPHRFPAILLLALGGALIVASCGGGDDPAPASRPEVSVAEDGGASADEPDVAPARTAAQDQRELETLVESFFFALASGDDDTVWNLITSDLQAEVARSDVRESVALVADAYEVPGFQFNGFRVLTIEGNTAEFQIDGFITDDGRRIGTDAQQADSPPLQAFFEGGRWRLSPDVSLLRLNQARVVVGE